MVENSEWKRVQVFAPVRVESGVDTDSSGKIAPSTTTDVIPAAQSSPSQTGTASWNFGQWVLAIPEVAQTCGNSAKHISECTNVGFVNDIYLPIIFK